MGRFRIFAEMKVNSQLGGESVINLDWIRTTAAPELFLETYQLCPKGKLHLIFFLKIKKNISLDTSPFAKVRTLPFTISKFQFDENGKSRKYLKIFVCNQMVLRCNLAAAVIDWDGCGNHGLGEIFSA